MKFDRIKKKKKDMSLIGLINNYINLKILNSIRTLSLLIQVTK